MSPTGAETFELFQLEDRGPTYIAIVAQALESCGSISAAVMIITIIAAQLLDFSNGPAI